ncbi:MBL fold metallo-hydrolase [Candidatus Neomarinimicrobiota bacterium]
MFVGIILRPHLILKVKTITSGPFAENGYIVYSESSMDCLIIDPGYDSQLYIETIEGNSLKPIAILCTHAHLDHIGAVYGLVDKYKIPFWLHRKDEFILNTFEGQCAMFGMKIGKKPKVTNWIEHEDSIVISDFRIKLVFTPGHTPGGTCYQISDHVFVGDTLFQGSVGRTDLPGGSWSMLEFSLKKLIKIIPPSDTIHSGHGSSTTLKEEILRNPFLIPISDKLNSKV